MTKPRVRIVILAAAVAAAIALAAAIVISLSQTSSPSTDQPIASITFEQSKAVPDFDGSTYTVTDADRLDEFAQLLEKHGITITELAGLAGNGCDGGTSTSVSIEYADGEAASALLAEPCDDGEPHAEFLDEATALLTSWKD